LAKNNLTLEQVRNLPLSEQKKLLAAFGKWKDKAMAAPVPLSTTMRNATRPERVPQNLILSPLEAQQLEQEMRARYPGAAVQGMRSAGYGKKFVAPASLPLRPPFIPE
jgi:hypothetical protein